jgi:dihydrofolate reductase
MKLSMIFAVAHNLVIGRDGALPWHLSSDMAFFRRHTMGKPIIMGRKTHESIGRPLPGRPNLILTRATDYLASGCQVFSAPPLVLPALDGVAEAVVIGGRDIYAAFLPYAERLYMTVVHVDAEGDTFLPPIHFANWHIESVERRPMDEKNDHAHTFFVLARSSVGHSRDHVSATRLPERFCSPATLCSSAPEN